MGLKAYHAGSRLQLRDTMDSYISAYKDPIVGIGPGWLKAILYFEIIFQVPFLVFGVFGALSGTVKLEYEYSRLIELSVLDHEGVLHQLNRAV